MCWILVGEGKQTYITFLKENIDAQCSNNMVKVESGYKMTISVTILNLGRP